MEGRVSNLEEHERSRGRGRVGTEEMRRELEGIKKTNEEEREGEGIGKYGTAVLGGGDLGERG